MKPTFLIPPNMDLGSILLQKEIYAIPIDYRIDCYYHFLVNLLFPLLELRLNNPSSLQKIFIPSLGGFDRFLPEMRGVLGLNVEKSLTRPTTDKPFIALESFDVFRRVDDMNGLHAYRPNGIQKERLIPVVKKARENFRASWPAEYDVKTDILVIERNDDRSISNLPELASVLSDRFPVTVEIDYLENMSLQEQSELFKNKRLIIGQHGSGLANLLWTADGECPAVMEIVPPSKQKAWHYQAMTIAMRLGAPEYSRVYQEADDGPVNIENVVKFLEQSDIF